MKPRCYRRLLLAARFFFSGALTRRAALALMIPVVAHLCAFPSRAQTPLAHVHTPGASAQPVGVPLRTIITFGDMYEGGDELYDVKITVVEVARAEKARQMVKAAGTANPDPPAGLEYLLARVRFEFAARVEPHHYSYQLDPAQFAAMSAGMMPYANAILPAAVKPELQATLASGESAEGWVAFVVPRGEHTPLMEFRADVGSVIHQGDASFFKLYSEPANSKK